MRRLLKFAVGRRRWRRRCRRQRLDDDKLGVLVLWRDDPALQAAAHRRRRECRGSGGLDGDEDGVRRPDARR